MIKIQIPLNGYIHVFFYLSFIQKHLETSTHSTRLIVEGEVESSIISLNQAFYTNLNIAHLAQCNPY